MNRFHVLVALVIGASVVFVAQNGFNRNYSDSMSNSNSPPVNPPPVDSSPVDSPPVNSPPVDSPPVNPPENPKNNLPPTPHQQPPNQPSTPQLPNKPAPPPKMPHNPPKEQIELPNPPDLITEDKLPLDPTDNEPLSEQSGEEAIADVLAEFDIEQEDNNETEDHEEKVHRHREHHEHHDDEATAANSIGDNVNMILLVSYFRSGSSFVGDLLQQSDGAFYTFEPFKYFNFNYKVDSDNEEEALRLIENIFKCSINREENYSDWMCEGNKAGSSIKKNQLLQESCESSEEICCDPDYVDQICSKSQIRVIKETRISLESVEKLLQALPQLKVIFLARDPRGMYNSRKRYAWCKKSSCIDYEQLCQDLTSDLKVYPRLVETYGDRVTIVRFEDIALYPFLSGEAIYQSLGLPYTPQIINFIDTHAVEVKTQPGDPFTVLHNPRELVSSWLTRLNETIVAQIQESCKFVLDQLGYKSVDLAEMTDTADNDLAKIYDVPYSLPNHL